MGFREITMGFREITTGFIKKTPIFCSLWFYWFYIWKQVFPPFESENFPLTKAASDGSFMARRCGKPCECMEGPLAGRHHVTRKLWRLCHSICLTKKDSLLVIWTRDFFGNFCSANSVRFFCSTVRNATDSMKIILEIVMSLQERWHI